MSVWRFSPRGPRVARRPRGRLAGVLLWALAWAAAGVVPPRALGATSLPSRQETVQVQVTGATVATYDDRTHQYVFRGPQVVVTRGADRLEAPEVLYNAAREQVVLPQRGRVSTPTLVVEADRIAADLAARHLVADGDVVARLLERGRWAVLTAARVEVDDRPGARRAVAQGAVRLVRGDEELTGSRVAYDLEARRAVVEGGRAGAGRRPPGGRLRPGGPRAARGRGPGPRDRRGPGAGPAGDRRAGPLRRAGPVRHPHGPRDPVAGPRRPHGGAGDSAPSRAPGEGRGEPGAHRRRSGGGAVTRVIPMERAREALRAEGLVKRYGDRTVVDHVSLSVRPREVVGLL